MIVISGEPLAFFVGGSLAVIAVAAVVIASVLFWAARR